MSIAFQVGSRPVHPQRIFCIGKNYPALGKEMQDPIPNRPVVFMKPAACLVPPAETIPIPGHGRSLHHEVEVVILIGKEGKSVAESDAESHIAGVTLGLDLTLRDVQADLKAKGHPWELSKAFERSAPIGSFREFDGSPDLNSLEFDCRVNGDLRQKGNTRDMIFPVAGLIHYLSKIWTLIPGDLIYTGTPSGVGPLRPGDTVSIQSEEIGKFDWEID